MKPVAFEYCRADTPEEAVALLAEFGGDASVLAGGMSLGAMLNMRLVRPRAVIDVNRLTALAEIRERDGIVETGALEDVPDRRRVVSEPRDLVRARSDRQLLDRVREIDGGEVPRPHAGRVLVRAGSRNVE